MNNFKSHRASLRGCRWLFYVWLVCFWGSFLTAKPREHVSERHLYVPELSAAESNAFIQSFRKARLAGDFWMAFTLKQRMDRETFRAEGILMGAWIDGQLCLRVELEQLGNPQSRVRLLMRRRSEGAESIFLYSVADGEIRELASTEVFFPPLVMSPLEFSMGFVYEGSYRYVGSKKAKSRPAHFYDFSPVGDVAKVYSRIRAGIDSEFYTLLRAEYYGPNSDVLLRVFNVTRFKKFGEDWLLRQVDVEDYVLDSKTTLTIEDAALRLQLNKRLFEVESLSESDGLSKTLMTKF